MSQNEQGTPVDVNDVINNLLQTISAQALQIAKIEALNKILIAEIQGLKKGQKGGAANK